MSGEPVYGPSPLEGVTRKWLAARACISEFLRELRPDLSQAHLDHNAAAIIARLASLKPPQMLVTMDEMKE